MNTRYINPRSPSDSIQAEFKDIVNDNQLSFPIAFQGNTSRNAINLLSICDAVIQNESFKFPIVCPASVGETARSISPTETELNELMKLGDHQLMQLSPLRALVLGLPIQITETYRKSWVSQTDQLVECLDLTFQYTQYLAL